MFMKIKLKELSTTRISGDYYYYTKPIKAGIDTPKTNAFTVLQMYEILGIEVPQLCIVTSYLF